jgi:ZIP family zinc transporter
VIAAIYGFAAGAILTMLATTMMPEAFDHADYVAGLATVLGFVVAFTISWAQG